MCCRHAELDIHLQAPLLRCSPVYRTWAPALGLRSWSGSPKPTLLARLERYGWGIRISIVAKSIVFEWNVNLLATTARPLISEIKTENKSLIYVWVVHMHIVRALGCKKNMHMHTLAVIYGRAMWRNLWRAQSYKVRMWEATNVSCICADVE
jgi:hypothetical protein